MACQFKEAIEYLSKLPATKKQLQEILDNDKVISSEFGKLIVDNYSKSVSELSLKEFAKGFGELIRNSVRVKETLSKELTLEQIKVGISRFMPARFSIKNGIEIADVTDQDAIVTAVLADMGIDMKEDTVLDQPMKNKALAEVTRVFDLIHDAKGTHFLLHELVHAGVVEHMTINPNEPSSKRIRAIYAYLYSNHESLGLHDGYWKTNIDEFIAEAMSNPKFIAQLMRVKIDKPISGLSDMYSVLLNTMLMALGFKGKTLDTLFSVLLDSTLKILEDKGKNAAEVSHNDIVKTGTVNLPSGEKLTIYKVASSILTKGNGAVLAARFNRSDKSIYLNDDKTVWDGYFENKNWTKPREQKDGSAAKAIREDAFATQRVMRDFIIQHEVAHYTLGARTTGETIGEYESRINEEAARVLGLKLYDTTSKKADLSSSRAKDMLPWEDDAEYAERKITLKNNGLKATDSDLNEEFSLETVEDYEARGHVETLVGEAAKAVVPKKMYHYAQSGTIDPNLKSNKKEKALFFFESRKDAEVLQAFLNQGKKDTIGKIFEASASLTSVDYIDNAEMLSTSALIDLTIEANNKGRDAIVANNMTEMGVGAGKQIGVFDLSNIIFTGDIRTPEKSLKATNIASELNEVIITDEEYEAIKESNQYYKDKHPKMFTFGEEYMYDPDNNIITLVEPGTSSDVDEHMHEVYTSHEIKHALTFEYLNDAKNKDVVTYLNNAIKVALDKFVPDYTIEGALLLDRLDYARRVGGVTSAAELVAILASEPNIRSKFIELFPQTQRTKLENILDNIKAFIVKMMGTDISDVIATIDAIVAQGKISEGKLPIQGFDKLFAYKPLDSIYFETNKKAAEGVKSEYQEAVERLMGTPSVKENVTDNAKIEDSILRKMNNEITIVKNGKKWKNIPLKKVLLNKDKTEITITAVMGKSWVSYTFPIDKATSKPTANGYTVTNEWLYSIAPQAIAQAKTQKKSKVVVLPIGTSGSGKSTWIATLPKNKYVVISPDEMRVEFTGDMNDKSKDTEIYKAVTTRTLKAIADGKQVIIDSTNLQKERRRDFIDSIKVADSSIEIQYKLMPLNPEVAKQRIKKDIADGVNRANVPDSTIDRHAKLYTDMLNDIKEEGMTEFKESAIMPTPVSSEAMLKANALIELAKKKCKG